MNTVRLEVVINAFQNIPDLAPSDIESLGIVLDMVARKNFAGASYSLKNVASARHFYPEEYREHIAFCKAIKLELMALGKEHYHQEVAKRIDFIFETVCFNVDTAILSPVIGYNSKTVLHLEKLEDAISFYDNRKEEFDPVISRILKEIALNHNLMQNYLKDL